jgi:hypothetical protein
MTQAITRFGDRLLERLVPRMTALATGPCQCVRTCCVDDGGGRSLRGTYIEHCFNGSACTGCRLSGGYC